MSFHPVTMNPKRMVDVRYMPTGRFSISPNIANKAGLTSPNSVLLFVNDKTRQILLSLSDAKSSETRKLVDTGRIAVVFNPNQTPFYSKKPVSLTVIEIRQGGIVMDGSALSWNPPVRIEREMLA